MAYRYVDTLSEEIDKAAAAKNAGKDPAMVGLGNQDPNRPGAAKVAAPAADPSDPATPTTTRYADQPATPTTDPVADFYKTIKQGSVMPDEQRRQALRAQALNDVQTQVSAIDAAYNTLVEDERRRQGKQAEQGAAQVSGISRLSGLGGSSVAGARQGEQAAAAAEVERQAVEALRAKQALEAAQAKGQGIAQAEARFAQEQNLAAQREKEYGDWLTAQGKATEPVEVGGVLVDPSTGRAIYDSRKPAAAETHTLSPGQVVTDADGKVIARNDSKDTKPVILNPGDIAFNADGTVFARGGAKPGGSGGGGGGLGVITQADGTKKLSPEAQYYYDNPSLLASVTPTKNQQIIEAFANAGVKFDAATLTKVVAGQRDTIAKYDQIGQRAQEANDLVDKVNTGPLAGTLSNAKQLLGKASPEFSAYKFAISDMNSVLLNLRSGAAVSPSEYERIKGMIPLITEDEKTAAQKIPLFLEAINSAKADYIQRSTQTTKQLMDSVNKPPATTPDSAQFSVRTPDGTLHVFHDQASLDGFKSAAGL